MVGAPVLKVSVLLWSGDTSKSHIDFDILVMGLAADSLSKRV